MQKLGSRCVYGLCALAILIGVYARTAQFVRCDPRGVSSDLVGTYSIWSNLKGEFAAKYVSNRTGEFTLAILIGPITDATGCDAAHALEAPSFVCSLGLIGVGALFAYALGGSRLDCAATAALLAISLPIADTSLAATSASPFILFCGIGFSLFLIYWRKGNAGILAGAVISLAIAAGIRGTALLHVPALVAALVLIHLLWDKETRPETRRIALACAGIEAAIALCAVARITTVGRIRSQYAEAFGEPPALSSYTPA